MTLRVIAGGVRASLWRLGLPTWAVESRWQVVHLDALTVLAHLDHSGPVPHGEARQRHLDARLDHGGCSAAAALPRRPVHRRHDPGSGGTPPAWLPVVPNPRDAAWTTRPWDGHPGDRGAFVVSRERRLAGSGGRGREPGRGLEAVGHRPWGMVRTLTAGGPRGRGRVSRPCRGTGRLPAVVGAQRPDASRHVARGRPRSPRRGATRPGVCGAYAAAGAAHLRVSGDSVDGCDAQRMHRRHRT